MNQDLEFDYALQYNFDQQIQVNMIFLKYVELVINKAIKYDNEISSYKIAFTNCFILSRINQIL